MWEKRERKRREVLCEGKGRERGSGMGGRKRELEGEEEEEEEEVEEEVVNDLLASSSSSFSSFNNFKVTDYCFHVRPCVPKSL